MALKRIIPGGFVANRCKPAKWFTSPLVALGFFNASQGATPSVPAAPTGFATSAIGGDSVDLVWDNVASVNWYVEVQLAGGDWTSPISNTPSSVNSLTVTGLSPSTTYDFRIQAQNAFGLGAWVELNGVSTSMVTPEVSRIVTAPDVGGSKHGKYFTLYDSGGSVSITLDGGARAQELQFDFVGLNGAAFNTNAEGKYVLIDGGAGGIDCYWFNTGSESQPTGLSAYNYHEVLVSAYDFSPAIAAALLGIATGYGFTDNSSSGDLCRLRNTFAGVTVNPDAGNAGAALTLEASGRYAAASPGTADRNIFITISDGLPAADIASSIKSTLDSDGAWFCFLSGNTVDITDISAGVRTDAADVDTGFTISTIQHGGGSALTIDNDTLDLVFAWSPSRRLRTLHTGPLLRLRDSTTTTEGNVGYDGSNELDTTARDAIIGAHDATAKVVYDQFIYGFDVSQATPAKQPALKVGGTVQTINGKQGLLFDGGSANVMQTASVSHGIATSDFCFSAIIKTDSSIGAWESILGFAAGGTPGLYINRGTKMGVFWGADYLSATTLSTNTLYVLTFLRQSWEYKFYVNGSLDVNHPAILFDNIADGIINLMSDTGSSDYGGGILLEAIFWKRIPTNLAAIIANQKAFAGI